jgi:hypothetical protein
MKSRVGSCRNAVFGSSILGDRTIALFVPSSVLNSMQASFSGSPSPFYIAVLALSFFCKVISAPQLRTQLKATRPH